MVEGHTGILFELTAEHKFVYVKFLLDGVQGKRLFQMIVNISLDLMDHSLRRTGIVLAPPQEIQKHIGKGGMEGVQGAVGVDLFQCNKGQIDGAKGIDEFKDPIQGVQKTVNGIADHGRQ